MKSTSFLSKAESLAKILIYFLLFTALFTSNSCSSDEPLDEVGIDNPGSDDPDPEDPEPEDPEPEDSDDSENVVFEENFVLDKDRKLVNFVLSNTEYNKFLTRDGDVEMISQKVYEYINDDFDFIFILSVEQSHPEGLYFGRSYKVKNDVEGLGMSIYDGTADYGSQGKLKSVIHMPRTEYIVSGPFLHEIAHYWSNHGFLPTTVGGHWGYSSAGGQLGGFDELINLGNNSYQGKLNGNSSFGTNANGGNGLPYSNVELYAMGLIGPGELNAIQVAENPESTGESGKFTADGITTWTGADLIAEHGGRVPSEQNSQKIFRALAVIISTSKISESKIDDINKDLENFSRQAAPDGYWGTSYNFWKATGERASLDIQVLDENLK